MEIEHTNPLPLYEGALQKPEFNLGKWILERHEELTKQLVELKQTGSSPLEDPLQKIKRALGAATLAGRRELLNELANAAFNTQET